MAIDVKTIQVGDRVRITKPAYNVSDSVWYVSGYTVGGIYQVAKPAFLSSYKGRRTVRLINENGEARYNFFVDELEVPYITTDELMSDVMSDTWSID